MISAIGLFAGLALLIYLTIRGVHILIAAPLAALLVALSAGLALAPPLAQASETDFITAYMDGFTSFLASWFFMFLLGAIFGEVMAASGAADSAAHWIVEKFGVKHAMLAVVVACALLTYGGVSVFIVAFSVYPMAASLFERANLPRRFIPAALAFGSVTFTMTSAGSPEIQNIIPIEYLGTSAYAGWRVSLIVAVLMAALGYWWLARMMARAKARGEKFEERPDDDFAKGF
ncbi:MAG: GntP family permease, partial [Hyphococcus sp.]